MAVGGITVAAGTGGTEVAVGSAVGVGGTQVAVGSALGVGGTGLAVESHCAVIDGIGVAVTSGTVADGGFWQPTNKNMATKMFTVDNLSNRLDIVDTPR